MRFSGSMAPIMASVVILAGAPAAPAIAALPASWDGLVKVETKRWAGVYLLPGADFRPYSKIMIDPAEVAFKKNWIRDYNSQQVGTTRRLDQADADRMAHKARDGFDDILAKAFTGAGYQLVSAPGPDVLRLSPAVLNVAVAAPDIMTPGISRTWSVDAGEATVVLEARDSQTGALLGRAVDRRVAGDRTGMSRNSVTNAGDFAQLFRSWAKTSADGLAVLKSMSPINASGQAPSR